MRKYHQWLENNLLSESLKAELEAIANDPEEIKERFYKDLEFGTGGMRGIIGAGTNRINSLVVGRATQGLANDILSRETPYPKCVIAHDSRHQSKEFSEMAARVLAASGIKTYLFNDIRSTPLLSFAVRELTCDAGIVFTASHNPPEYNGYKVYGKEGCQLLPDESERLVSHIEALDFKDVQSFTYEEGIKNGLIVELDDTLDHLFYEKALSMRVRPDVDKNLKIVYTPLHGAGAIPVPTLLKAAGYKELHVVEEQLVADPNFTTAQYPNPEEEQALELAYNKGCEVDADMIIANDPDCDRVGVAVKSEEGEYQLLSGNQVGALLMNYLFEAHSENHTLPQNPYVVKTIVTSELGRDIATKYGAECFDTLTGFKFIGELMERYEVSKEKQYIFGYEESIGYTVGPYVRDKDAVTASLLIAEMAAYYKTKGMTLLTCLDHLYEEHGYYVEKLESLTMKGIAGQQKISEIMNYFRNATIDQIAGYKIIEKQDYLEGYNGLPPSNVLKFTMKDKSWFVLRPSGTEPKIKIYFSTVDSKYDQSQKKSNQIVHDVVTMIEKVDKGSV